MEVDCEDCAGCCVDWRSLADVPDHERRGPRQPLDDTYNLVPLTREDVRAFVDVRKTTSSSEMTRDADSVSRTTQQSPPCSEDAGLADALTPRLWIAEDGPSVELDGREVAAIRGKPAFFVGIRKTPKPVGPFDTDPSWLPTCAFLDPATLQCRIHDSDVYPQECAQYPRHNLALDVDTECERVERHVGGDRLLDGDPPEDLSGLLFGPQAVGEKVFAYPDVDDLRDGFLDRLVAGDLTREDRARFVGVAAASAPGTTAVEPTKRDQYAEAARDADSWAGRAIEEWQTRAERDDPDPVLAEQVEVARGAPGTPGWDAD